MPNKVLGDHQHEKVRKPGGEPSQDTDHAAILASAFVTFRTVRKNVYYLSHGFLYGRVAIAIDMGYMYQHNKIPGMCNLHRAQRESKKMVQGVKSMLGARKT